MVRRQILALLLFTWLWLPGLLVLSTDQVSGFGDSLSILGLTLFILLCPLVAFPRVRAYFLLLSPLALVAGPVAFFTYFYRSVPGDALVQAVLHTDWRQSLLVLDSFGPAVWLTAALSLAYIPLAAGLPRAWIVGPEARRRLLAVLLTYAALALSAPLVTPWVRIPLAMDFGALSLAFPVNLAMAVDRDARARAVSKRASVSPKPRDAEPVLVLLVIGDSLRPDHMQLYGYARPTTPRLVALREELLVFTDMVSNANATYSALPGIVEYPVGAGRATLTASFREAGFRTAWISNHEPEWGSGDAHVAEFNTSSRDFMNRLDRQLLPLFTSFVRQAGPRQFIVMHLQGSHIPYDARYPDAMRRFTPTLRERGISVPQPPDKAWAINSYDNTVLETDHVLAATIDLLRREQRPAVMVFVSDHGENLFDDERRIFMHAQPQPTRYDIRVPLLVWMNDAYRAARPEAAAALQAHTGRRAAHAALFSTILDLGGLDWNGRPPGASLARPDYTERARMVVTGEGAVEFESLR